MSIANRVTMEEARALGYGGGPATPARPGGARGWSAAKPTRGCLRCGAAEERVPLPGDHCVPACGGRLRRFGSKMEARVHSRLRASLKPGQRLYCQVRLPLLTIAPDDSGLPMTICIDFAIVGPGHGEVRLIDAKGKRVSRDWRRGAAAAEAWYGAIEEVTE